MDEIAVERSATDHVARLLRARFTRAGVGGPRLCHYGSLWKRIEPELIDVITSHEPNEGSPQVAANGNSHADRVQEALGNMFMDITCSHCGSNKVMRAGACGVCTECGTSQGCS